MRRLLLAALILLCSALSGVAQQIDLHGLHAVTVDADDPSFADPGFDDSGWARIQVPSSLRAAGIDGRPDVFWYRIAFDLPADWSGSSPAIRLGVITRSDETYLNGVRIASANAPAVLDFEAGATTGHSDTLAVNFADFPVSQFIGDLQRLPVEQLAQFGGRELYFATGRAF